MSEDDRVLVHIVPRVGSPLLGKIKVGEEYGDDRLAKVEEAILCEPLKVQASPGRVSLSYLITAYNLVDPRPITVFVQPGLYFIVEKDSPLYKLYEQKLVEFAAQRANIHVPGAGDIPKLTAVPSGEKH